MKLVIDGYNLLAATSGLSFDLPNKEERLLDRLAQSLGKYCSKTSVVFDGHRDHWASISKTNHQSLCVLFTSPGLSADQVIIDQFIKNGMSQSLFVVTSDREIAYHAKKEKVTIIKSEKFWYYCNEHFNDSSDNENEPFSISKYEVNQWMQQFGGSRYESNNS